MISRRDMLALSASTAMIPSAVLSAGAQTARSRTGPKLGRWVATTRSAAWRATSGAKVRAARVGEYCDVELIPSEQRQTMEGVGASFSEMGWDVLRRLSPSRRDAAMAALFDPSAAAFTLCRLPIGANDLSLGAYSYDETPGDFALRNFSVRCDENGLIPFVYAAQRYQPALRFWASPWSPPSWMKTNGFYATRANEPGWPDNHIASGAIRKEGTDAFVQDPRYFDAYARYFGRYIDAYHDHGVSIGMVMPQNEFNSPQGFPSCPWTPAGLAHFLPYLGKEMAPRGVEIFLGTIERGDDTLAERVLADPAAASVVKGLGIQWAGRGALPWLHRAHPELRIYQSEQECGDGRNDWRYCLYVWSMMKTYLHNGACAWQYWNMALGTEGKSHWGWPQNALITVDVARDEFRLNPEYWLLRHLSQFVRPGAVRIEAVSWLGYEDVLAFLDPSGTIVVIAFNPLPDPMPMRIKLGDTVFEITLEGQSFNSFELSA